MKLYYWNGKPNLGDALNRVLFPQAEWAPPKDAEWVGAGSVVELFDGFHGTVFGSGRGGPSSPPTDLRRANVLALRGKKTRFHVKMFGSCVLGDPGLLVSDHFTREYGEYTAVVPHFLDRERMMTLYPGSRFVDVTGDVTKAITAIANAGQVVSSSLHGLVLADAFGIPRMWDWFDGVQGKGFKFEDYGTVMGPFEPGQWVEVGAQAQRVKAELRECLSVSVS